jgi:hypothetical protein
MVRRQAVAKDLIQVVLIDFAIIVVLRIPQASKVEGWHLRRRQADTFEMEQISRTDRPNFFHPMRYADVVEHFHCASVDSKCSGRALRGRPFIDEAAAYAASQQFVSDNQACRTAPDNQYCRVDHLLPSLARLEPLPLTS